DMHCLGHAFPALDLLFAVNPWRRDIALAVRRDLGSLRNNDSSTGTLSVIERGELGWHVTGAGAAPGQWRHGDSIAEGEGPDLYGGEEIGDVAEFAFLHCTDLRTWAQAAGRCRQMGHMLSKRQRHSSARSLRHYERSYRSFRTAASSKDLVSAGKTRAVNTSTSIAPTAISSSRSQRRLGSSVGSALARPQASRTTTATKPLKIQKRVT